QELAGDEADKAYAALWTLVAAPKQSVPFVRRQAAAPAAGIRVEQIRRWIKELDDDDFAVREKASAELARHVEGAAVLLEQELKRDASPEVSRRIERLLAGRPAGGGERRREEAAVRVLEYVGSVEAREVLVAWARGAEGAGLTEAAKAALARL